ncbi:hypothetical protein [Pseudomonas fluorescens]|uniref:hypothetical protein n=1 Tax=Pseudomonas fluorescens TaxID=294 RepID=UPI000AE483C6|nr:hypothetical protein [Pseudomonas fluorescens]
MSGTKLIPENITSPFQLMAAWFSMLVLLVGVLLAAAIKIEKPEWAAGYLVICSTILIMVVLGCVTLMLTKFRPHLQDGKEYAQWLRSTGKYTKRLDQNGSVVESRASSVVITSTTSPDDIPLTPLQGYGTANISNLSGCEKLAEKINAVGITTYLFGDELNERSRRTNFSEHESIWLGKRVSSNYVSAVFKIASEYWPHLKYVHLSSDGPAPPDDVHDEIFVGGATKTALSYGLKPWSQKELSSINGAMRIEELHELIRSKYSE